jgi:serine/threonine protein kinase
VDGQIFIAMERVEGQTLRDKLLQNRLSLPEILSIASEIAEALDRAHKEGIVQTFIRILWTARKLSEGIPSLSACLGIRSVANRPS